MAEREHGKLLTAVIEEYFAAADYKPTGSQFDYGCEDRVKVVLGAGLQDMKLQAKSAGRRPHVSRQDFGIGISRVDARQTGSQWAAARAGFLTASALPRCSIGSRR